MISREEVEQIGEIVSESKNTYSVRTEDGKSFFICKYCGSQLEQSDMFRHFNPRHKDCCKIWLEERKRMQSVQSESMQSKHSLTREEGLADRLLTPEEEMLEEMVKVLRLQMESTPGIGSNDKTDWFVEHYFRNVKTVQENPQELFKQLKKYFPKADDDAISLIVNNVFRVRDEYMQSRSVSTFSTTPQFQFQPPMLQYYQSSNTPYPPPGDTTQLMLMITQQMMKQQEQFYQMLLHEAKNRVDPNAIRAQVENEFLKRHLQKLEEQLNKMAEILSDNRRAISPEGWRDDYARLVAEMGDKILTLGERIIIENKKFRQTLIKYLAPKIIGEESREYEPSGEGKTDKEIIAELEEEGLVEEG